MVMYESPRFKSLMKENWRFNQSMRKLADQKPISFKDFCKLHTQHHLTVGVQALKRGASIH